MYCLKKGEICDDLKKVHVTWYRLCNTGVSKDINAQIRSKMAAGSKSSRQLSEEQFYLSPNYLSAKHPVCVWKPNYWTVPYILKDES